MMDQRGMAKGEMRCERGAQRIGNEGNVDLVCTPGPRIANEVYTTPCRLPTFVKAATARSRCSRVCAAEIWTLILASPLGTTGKLKPIT